MIGTSNDVMGYASLGASTFLASAHPSESCGSNGLPLTPNSVRILGRAQLLYTVSHPHLCSYVAVQRGKHERLIVVQEYYKFDLLTAWKQNEGFRSEKRLTKMMHEVLQGLVYLNKLSIASCCNVCPHNILIDPFGQAKLYSYGLHYMTEQGAAISFPIGTEYSAPEVLISGACPELRPSGGGGGNPASDVWSLGLMLLRLLLCSHDTSDNCVPLDVSIATVLLLAANSDYEDLASAVVEQKPQLMKVFENLSDVTRDLLRSCLKFSPQSRSSPAELLEHPAFADMPLTGPVDPAPTPFPRPSVASPPRKFSPPSEMLASYPLPEECMKHDKNGIKNSLGCLRERSLREVYHLWQLAGGHPEQELVKHGFITTRPPILTLPSIATVEGEVLGGQYHRLQQQQPSHATLALSLAGLECRLAHILPATYYPLIMQQEDSTDNIEARKLPLVIREKDVEYQLHRIILFRRLLKAYPYYRSRIEAEARMDVPPFYRGEVWAALLGVDGDTIATYAEIDKVTPTSTDRQIEVDIPRCHQYDELLSSPRAHAKFTRLLKAWVVSHPGLVYWQGLDSLTAPFLYLNFNNEPLAYACLTAFIDKYLYKFFLRDNSAVIQEYLAKFSHLVAFHDPLLFSHLASIGFVPELYAIPWFLTMYTREYIGCNI
ncbi:Rab-GTPase-TBC domain [Trinorchestia longiramus]|nr:Rab-GTPase-TBC domain [Trinorchestia longiramus]